jgi:hypothetical protein
LILSRWHSNGGLLKEIAPRVTLARADAVIE